MANLFDKLEGTDKTHRKPMTNQEYVNDYLAKRLGMLKAEERQYKEREEMDMNFHSFMPGGFFGNLKTKADIIGNIKYYLDLKGGADEYEYDDTSRFSHIQNQMQLEYDDWYKEKNDSEFIDTIIEELGIKTEGVFKTESGFFYTHELIKVLADIASSKEGFNKIVDAMKVMFEKSKDIMPNPNCGHTWFVRDVKKLDETLDNIVEYGHKHGILEGDDV